MLSSETSKSCCRPLMSNRSAFSFASHSRDSSSFDLYCSSECCRSASLSLMMAVCVVFGARWSERQAQAAVVRKHPSLLLRR